MTNAPEPTTCQGSARWPLVALGLLAAGWVGFLMTAGYAGRLEEEWGPAPDVVDSLAQGAYVWRHTHAYFTAVVVLDWAALVALLPRTRRGWPLAVKVLAGVLWLPSAGLHVLGCVIPVSFTVRLTG